MRSTFHIFTDGSVIGNPGFGGWAAILMSGDESWEMSGSSPWTTISEMELLAAVEALHSIPVGSDVQLCVSFRQGCVACLGKSEPAARVG
jgi:ribonuclease HI